MIFSSSRWRRQQYKIPNCRHQQILQRMRCSRSVEYLMIRELLFLQFCKYAFIELTHDVSAPVAIQMMVVYGFTSVCAMIWWCPILRMMHPWIIMLYVCFFFWISIEGDQRITIFLERNCFLIPKWVLPVLHWNIFTISNRSMYKV